MIEKFYWNEGIPLSLSGYALYTCPVCAASVFDYAYTYDNTNRLAHEKWHHNNNVCE